MAIGKAVVKYPERFWYFLEVINMVYNDIKNCIYEGVAWLKITENQSAPTSVCESWGWGRPG